MNTLRSFRGKCLLSALLWGCSSSHSLGESAEMPPAAPATTAAAALPDVTAKSLQSQIAETKSSTKLDDAAKEPILAAYQMALAELDRAAALEKQAAAFRLSAQTAPDRLRAVRAELDRPTDTGQPDVPPEASTAELETKLSDIQNQLAQAQDELTRLEAEPQRRAERRLKSLPAQLDAANKTLDDILKQAAVPAAADETKEMTTARLALLAARQLALHQEIACCTVERESYNAEDELLPKDHDRAERHVAVLKQLVDAWQRILHQRRQREAEAKLSTAKREKQHAYPELRGVAEENEELARRVAQINNDVAAASKQTVEFANAQSDLKREFNDVVKKAELGLAQQLGPYLLQCRTDLQRRRRQLEAERLPDSKIEQVRAEWLDLTEHRKKLGDIDQRAETVLRRLDLSTSKSPREALLAEVRRLLHTRRELIDSLISAYVRYFGEIASVTAAEKELFDAIAQQSDYIDERIFWVRSTSRLGIADFAAAGEALRWYGRPQEWLSVGGQLLHSARVNLLPCFLTAVVIIGLLATQLRMRDRVRKLGEQAIRGTADDMSLTLRALIFTLLMSAPWPLLLAMLGSLLEHAPDGSELGRALAHGLMFSAVALASMEFLRQVCRGRGLGASHFGWPEQSTRLLRHQLRWFMPIALPITLLAATTHALENDRWQALGRLLFIVAMTSLSLFLHRVLRPIGGVLHEFLAYRRGGWVDRLHHVSHPLLTAGPLTLAVLAGMGYYYTARQLAWRFHGTGWLLVAFLISGALLLRWLLIMRRRLAIRQARMRRAAVQHEQRGPDGAELPGVAAAAEGQLDLTTINLQTQRFVQTALMAGLAAGLWLIWSDVLPALTVLNVPLWHISVEQPGVAVPQLQPVNVVHLLEALIAVVLTLVATRNIPGLLEIVLLQRLPLEPATRYAVTTLFRYAIAVTGVVVSCAALGITWAKVHWLIAAVSVGLGFGLQEIFANFISGLIILFERPIRVGDVVTVDDVSGVVSRIRIRATMITDFDRKELIVPNKEFITGRVLNWTLSDQMNRVTVNVGVAYGSDIERARELLLRAAAENPFVLKDPAPMASFEGFGDSVLNLVLRCYLPNLENRLAVTHDLHTKIHDTFRDEGIDIAFPQLDLHIRTTPVALYQQQRQAG